MSPSAKPSVDTLATPGSKIHTAMSAIVKGELDAYKIAVKSDISRSTMINALNKLKVGGFVGKDHTLKNLYRLQTRSKGKKTKPQSEQSNNGQTESNTGQTEPNSGQTPSVAELLGRRILATIQQDNGVKTQLNDNKTVLNDEQKTLSELVGSSVSGVGDGGNDVFRANLLLTGEPIIRKVVFNPKTLLIYDYMHTKLNYPGDMAAFLNDCVDYFCKGKGLEVSVSLKEAVTSW